MSRNGTLLPLPDDPRFPALIAEWPEPWMFYPHPRTSWLHEFERLLRITYPSASAADRKLTARHHAPFPLAAGSDVP